MFNLFNKKNKTEVIIKPQIVKATIEEIHRDFETVSDRNLEEAYRIVNNIDKDGLEKANRLKALGFRNSSDVTSKVEHQNSLDENTRKSEILLEMKERYPNYKFISIENVSKICEKYGLYCGPASHFTGNVPTRNLIAIENYKEPETFFSRTISKVNFNWGTSEDIKRKSEFLLSKFCVINNKRSYSSTALTRDAINYLHKNGITTDLNYVEGVTENLGFEICAPASDFNTDGLFQEGNFFFKGPSGKLKISTAPMPDPVVLKRISDDGFLIITAWGPEASDPLVVNENNN